MNRLLLLVAFALLAPFAHAATRQYYIAAEDVPWDYAPSHRDLINALPLPQPWAQQTEFNKSRFIEYTDGTFTIRKPQPEWLGILGPIIRAEVGDSIVVEFLNRSRRTHGIHPHGLRYDKKSEGALYVGGGMGALVAPGQRYTYHWTADEESGPGLGGPSSIVWWYHPHRDEPMETNAGLLGPIIVTAKGKAKPDGSPKDVDQEFVALFMIFDEVMAKHPDFPQNFARYKRDPKDETGIFHAINGYVFGNLPGLIVKSGDRVRWHLLGMGGEEDIHTAHWHGKTVQNQSRRTDVVELLPASMVSVDMLADNPGTWLFHCQVTDHMEAGMMATYSIVPPAPKSCPVKFVSGEFWKGDEFSLTVENPGTKTIRRLILTPGMFLSRLDLRPSVTSWIWTKPIAPGGQITITTKDVLHNSASIEGWAFFPAKIEYDDGSSWTPEHPQECFHVFWRDAQHPDLTVLPPLQVEHEED